MYIVIEMTWFAQTELMVSLYQAILTQRNSLLLHLIILITKRRQCRVWVVLMILFQFYIRTNQMAFKGSHTSRKRM